MTARETIGMPMGGGNVPPWIIAVMDRIQREGFSVYLVGGALRDLLLGRVPKDWDLASSAPPGMILELFPRVIPIGLKHGTVTVHDASGNVEVTCYEATGSGGILEDLARRDFTINAMAMTYPEGAVMDPHGGYMDIRTRVLRCVLDPFDRFKEDPLRILRGARFMSTLGFKIHRSVTAAARCCAPEIDRVAAERVREELVRALLGDRAPRALYWLYRIRMMHRILPEIFEHSVLKKGRGVADKSFRQSLHTIQCCPRRFSVRMAALLSGLRSEAASPRHPGARGAEFKPDTGAGKAVAVMRRLRMSQKERLRVTAVMENQLTRDIKTWSSHRIRVFLSSVGSETVDDVMDLALARSSTVKEWLGMEKAVRVLRRRIDLERESKPPLAIGDLRIDGADIMRLLREGPGPRIGTILRKAHDCVLRNPECNTPEKLQKLVMTLSACRE